MNKIQIFIFTTKTGKVPFQDWQKKLDPVSRAIIRTRLARIELGNFGDCKPIKNGTGIYEFRIKHGPGYRIYFGKKGTQIIILLVGGDKGSQARDIEKAKKFWGEYKEQ